MITTKRRQNKWDPVKHPGSLERFGYSLRAPARVRHQALGKARKTYGYKRTVQKLAFLAGAADLPEPLKARARADLRWFRKTYGRR